MSIADDIRRKLYSNTSEPVRAVIYARVSTENEGQKESCANQVELAERYIAKYPNIEIVGIFVDDGISAKNDFTRPKYNEMLGLISERKVDLIIAKDLSRLNRNDTTSSILKELCVGTNTTILTLDDNVIQDFDDPNSEMMYGFRSIIDAQYVRKQSINGRKTHELRCQRKELSAKDCAFGYTWNRDEKTITINEEEAEVVRFIFDEYVFRNGTPASIHLMLKERGINLTARVLGKMIESEKYIGKFYINRRSTKLGTGQTKSVRIYIPKEQWVLVERPDLQIVDTDIFSLAQRIHKTRITIYNKPDRAAVQSYFHGTHLFAGKILCPVCGKLYQFCFADTKNTYPIYRIRNHTDCPNPVSRIDEDDMVEITKKALRRIFNEQSDVLVSLENDLIEIVKSTQNNGDEIARLKKQKASREKQIDALIENLTEDGLTGSAKERIRTKINVISTEIENISASIAREENNVLSPSFVQDKIAQIKSAFVELRKFKTIDRDRVLNYIEKVEIPESGDIDITLRTVHGVADIYPEGGEKEAGGVLLTAFSYIRKTPTKREPGLKTEVTVHCYLKTESD